MSNAEIICDVDPKDLEGGRILRYLVNRFFESRDSKHYVDALNCLRDSQVVIPGVVRMNDEFVQELHNAKGGGTFSFDKKMGFVPDIIEVAGGFYLAVFSNPEQMGEEYGNNSSTITIDFLEALDIAEARKELAGIVVDSLTVPFYVTKNLYEFARNLPSRLDPEKTEKHLTINYVKGAPAEPARIKLKHLKKL